MNRITQLFGIKYPIVQGGMIWASGYKLASAVSNAGGLGLIGAGSMYPHILEEHIIKCKAATNKPYGINVPLLYPNIDQIMDLILKHEVKIVFTSAGNPATWTPKLKEAGITVVHVVANTKFAQKSVDAGVDAIVAEGFEAGGHNGREETTTMVLIPQIKKAVTIPLIAAGGIGFGNQMAAALALGADGIQVGSRFAASSESSSHQLFKDKIIAAKEGDTKLSLKKLTPVRLLKNKFAQEVQAAEMRGASEEELTQLLGRARAKLGMFEGNLDEGELEIGQISSLINKIESAKDIIHDIINEYHQCIQRFQSFH